jgi:hypothetical protein
MPLRKFARLRATHHVNQRSFYFADPDGNTLEIYYELPCALELFPEGRADQDEALKVTRPGAPCPIGCSKIGPYRRCRQGSRSYVAGASARLPERCSSTLHTPPPATNR